MSTLDRDLYPHWVTVPTRWSDNDQFGHVNNAVHYSVMDTTINNWFKVHGFDVAQGGDTINLIPETGCRYLAEMSYPDTFEVGLRALSVGRSSVRWECALVRASDGALVALATSAHVFVDAVTRRPSAVPESLRGSLEALVTTPIS
ncbi:acyl-CoA thioesterase [Janibacter limosus]|jgi:acyl-CoA thioester hydrolase|uniref:acyl-CoA thioesterase n=1 Tax=Janibacter limosus TaxID=53458 RepID=UPI0008375B53|nr:thioesterase family protein [Janibacter limosus]